MVRDFVEQYFGDFRAALDALDGGALGRVLEELEKLRAEGRRLFVAGNGGSAATAEHFFCDFSKNAVQGDEGRFKVISLSGSTARITALGNDIGFEHIFSEQLKNLMEDGDLMMLISASGSSPDLVAAAEYARSRGNRVIALTGFSGGKLRETADFKLHAELSTYEQIEDFHSMICHMIVCWFRTGRNRAPVEGL